MHSNIKYFKPRDNSFFLLYGITKVQSHYRVGKKEVHDAIVRQKK